MIETQRQRKRIFGLDLLRVISIALVLCSHTSWIYPPSSSLLSKMVDMCGFFGVELFFVMSGFLIGGIIFRQFIREDYSFKTSLVFIYRRLMRILPNYYLIIFVNIIIWLSLGYSIAQTWKYFFFWQNFASPLLPFFPESWSLPIKEYGYVIAVLLLYAASVVFKKASHKVIFLSVIVGMMVFFFLTKLYYNFHTANTTMLQWDVSLRSVVVYRIDTVLLGVLAGYVATEYPGFWKRQRFTFAIIGMMVLGTLLFCLGYLRLKIADFPLFWNVLCLPMNAVGLASFLPLFSDWKSAPARITKPIEIISELSYCVYLLHYSVVLFLMKHFIDTSQFTIPQLHLYTIAYLTITFSLSYLMYTYFEKPMMKLREIKT
jgi:peptidoglycan/LPS O-acetylase OafA/YrhL